VSLEPGGKLLHFTASAVLLPQARADSDILEVELPSRESQFVAQTVIKVPDRGKPIQISQVEQKIQVLKLTAGKVSSDGKLVSAPVQLTGTLLPQEREAAFIAALVVNGFEGNPEVYIKVIVRRSKVLTASPELIVFGKGEHRQGQVFTALRKGKPDGIECTFSPESQGNVRKDGIGKYSFVVDSQFTRGALSILHGTGDARMKTEVPVYLLSGSLE
jgi:hypothetical protein